MLFLALTQPSAVELAAWMMCLFALAGGVNQVLRLTDRMKERPPPSETYVTLSSCGKLHASQDLRIQQVECAMTAIRTEAKEDREELARAAESRAVALHERINKVLEAVSELRGEMKRLGRNL